MKQPYLECGKIVNTHGVRGGVKLESYCDSPAVLASLPTLFLRSKSGIYEAKRIIKASVGGGRVIAYLDGVSDLDAAAALKGVTVYAKREHLPLAKGAYFIADLIGLPLIDADTERVYGHITAVESSPASDLYTVRTPTGREVLFPAVDAFVVAVDTEHGVSVRPISGFFDEEDAT